MSSLETISIGDDVGECGCVGSPYASIECVEKLLSYMSVKDLEYLREVCTLLIESDANNTH